MKKLAWIFGSVFILIIGYIAAGPYLTIYFIKSAVTEKNPEKLAEYIDFPLLRQNLKDQLNAKVLTSAATELESSPLATLAAGLATKIVDGVVDTLITPNSLAKVMEGKNPTKASQTESTSQSEKKELFKDAKLSYDSINRFSILVPYDQGQEARFILVRNGLHWKLTNLIVPLEDKLIKQ